MKKSFITVILLMGAVLFASDTPIKFQKTFGGEYDDMARSVISTKDGYLIAGKTKSFSRRHSNFDAYLIKIDKNGKKIWSKKYGGDRDDEANDITKLGKDFAFIGTTESFGNERSSFYVTKIDSNGKMYWKKSLYGTRDDEFYGNALVEDKNALILAGQHRHLLFFAAQTNPYLLKINEKGNKQWGGFFGGEDEDSANAIINTKDGYLMVGETESYGNGDFDSYVVKLDKSGKKVWYSAYGGEDDDVANDVISTKDGYLIVGTTKSFDQTYKDIYVIKIDKKGKTIWQKTYGGDRDDEGYGVVKSPDGGYVITGTSNSFSRQKGYDLYLIKIDDSGNLEWDRRYGGERDEIGRDLVATKDGYLIVGQKQTKVGRDNDVWVLKVDLEGR